MKKFWLEEGIAGGIISGAAVLVITSMVVGNGETYSVFLNDKNDITSMIQVAIAFLLPIVGIVIGFLGFGRQDSWWHVSGAELLSGSFAQDALENLEDNLKSKRQKNGDVKGLVIGGVEFSRTREVGHIAMYGLPGSGKTVLLNNVVHQIMNRGEKIILHDPKGDFTSWIYNENDTILLGPWDARAAIWDIGSDINEPALAVSFADALTGDLGGSENKFFSDAARDLIAGVIKYFISQKKPWGWHDLGEIFDSGAENMVRIAKKGDPIVSTMISEEKNFNKTTQNILAIVATATSWMSDYANCFEKDAKPFSVRKWLADEAHNNVKKVILNNNLVYQTRSQQIFGAIVSAAAAYICSSFMPERSADAPGIWIVLDEYVQLGDNISKSIQKIEELGRSRGVRIVRATQDETQLAALTGQEKAEAAKSVQQTRIYAKTSSTSASTLSQRLGTRTIARCRVDETGKKHIEMDKENIVRVEDLTGLKVLKTGVEIIVHVDDVIAKLVQPFLSREITKPVHPQCIIREAWAQPIKKERVSPPEEKKGVPPKKKEPSARSMREDPRFMREEILREERRPYPPDRRMPSPGRMSQREQSVTEDAHSPRPLVDVYLEQRGRMGQNKEKENGRQLPQE